MSGTSSMPTRPGMGSNMGNSGQNQMQGTGSAGMIGSQMSGGGALGVPVAPGGARSHAPQQQQFA